MSQKVFKTGNSLAVTIPADFVRSVGVRPGDTVRANIRSENGELLFIFSGAKQLALLDDSVSKKISKKKSNEKV